MVPRAGVRCGGPWCVCVCVRTRAHALLALEYLLNKTFNKLYFCLKFLKNIFIQIKFGVVS